MAHTWLCQIGSKNWAHSLETYSPAARQARPGTGWRLPSRRSAHSVECGLDSWPRSPPQGHGDFPAGGYCGGMPRRHNTTRTGTNIYESVKTVVDRDIGINEAF